MDPCRTSERSRRLAQRRLEALGITESLKNTLAETVLVEGYFHRFIGASVSSGVIYGVEQSLMYGVVI